MIYPQVARQLAASWRTLADNLDPLSVYGAFQAAAAFRHCASDLEGLANMADDVSVRQPNE